MFKNSLYKSKPPRETWWENRDLQAAKKRSYPIFQKKYSHLPTRERERDEVKIHLLAIKSGKNIHKLMITFKAALLYLFLSPHQKLKLKKKIQCYFTGPWMHQVDFTFISYILNLAL